MPVSHKVLLPVCAGLCDQGLDFYLAASDSAARLPHEDSAQLPPPEEDGEGKQHACEKLTRRAEPSLPPKASAHAGTSSSHMSPLLALALHFNVVP